jgi:hypothetical protein
MMLFNIFIEFILCYKIVLMFYNGQGFVQVGFSSTTAEFSNKAD